MPVDGSARSVYSAASHLLSPRSLDSSSPAPSASQSASSSRSATPLLPSNRPYSSLYPSSRHSGDGLFHPSGVSLRAPLTRMPRGTVHPEAAAQLPSSLATSPALEGRYHGNSSTASTPCGLSRSSSLAASTPRPRNGFRGESEPLSSAGTPPYHYGVDSPAPSLAGRGASGNRRASSWTSDERGRNHSLDIFSEVILAFDVDKDGNVGCAYYVAMDESLVLEEDIPMGGLEAVDTLLLQVQPTSVIIPNRAPGELIELLERDAHKFDDNGGSNAQRGAYILRHTVSAQFDYEAAKEALARVDLGDSQPDPVRVVPAEEGSAQSFQSSLHNKLVRLSETINLDGRLAVGCAGAVLNDLDKRRTTEDASPDEEEDGVTFRVKSIEMNTCDSTLLLNADALISLQILRSEPHPNPQTRSSDKEALSVTGLLLALASSAQGKRRLRQILLRPTANLSVLDERHKSIEVLLQADNCEIAKTMRKLLRKLKNTKTLLLHVRMGVDRIRGQLSIRVGDWKALLRFAMVTAQLKHAIRGLRGASGIGTFSRISDEIDINRFFYIGDVIIQTIDFQLSQESGRTEILPGASEHLDELRQELTDICEMLPELKESVVRQIPPRAAEYIRYCTIMPDLGFLTAVSMDPETGEGIYHGQDLHDDEWTMVFFSRDIVYYKNRLMLDLDSQYGDLPSRITNEEIAVMMGLAAGVMDHEEAILGAAELFGELDSMLALALAAEKYNWVAPTMTCSNVLDIVGGRHPLQELLVPSFIPNDCTLAGGYGRGVWDDPNADRGPSMLILTGPNSSGKSVYMKQVALIVYLAHTGSYVPVTRATIGLTDQILTRISTRETVADDESAFMVDLKQAAYAMNFGTRRSLFVIDEFGKGTSAESGAALFGAYLDFLLQLGSEKPKVLAGTHFHEIFEHGILEPSKDLAFAHLDTHVDMDAEDPRDKVTFLYRLLPGRDTRSLGILCAAAHDMPEDMVRRALEIMALQENNEDLAIALAEVSEEEKQRLAEAELITRRFLAWDIPTEGPELDNIRETLEAILRIE